MRRYTFAAVAVLLVVFPWRQAPTGDQVAYSVEALETSASIGGLVPAETGINASGEVVGTLPDDGVNGTRAVRYTDGVGWEYVPGLTGGSTAAGVNVYGDIVGTRSVGGVNHAYRYTAATGVVDDIMLLPNGTAGAAGYAINDNGDVVGISDAGGGNFRGFVARLGQALVMLPTLGGTFDQACGINNAGQIAETSSDASGNSFAVRIEADDTTLLNAGTVDGSTPGMSGACAIDDFGHIGGSSSSNGFMAFHAFRWDPGHPVVADAGLPSTSGNVESISAGVSAGWYQVTNADTSTTNYALLYTDANGAVDLNTQIAPNSGWVLSQIKGINASGQMVGDGLFNGVAKVFRLNPSKPADTTPPVISNLSVTPSNLAVVNGQLDPVAVSFTATDNSGVAPTCALSVGPGVAGTDYVVTNANNASVKAVSGRVYSFTVACSDAAGNSSSGSTNVTVATDSTGPVMSPVVANPSTIGPPLGQMVPVTISVSATDDSGVVSCGLASIGGGTPGVDSQITGTFTGSVKAVGGRVYTFTAQCTDFTGNPSVGSATVVVPAADTTPPVISTVSASPNQIWPPNGKFVPVSVMVTATDNVDSTPSCSLTSISGGAAGSSVVTGQYTGNVRSDDGAVYVLTVTCSDRAGNKATATATVSVTKVNGNSGTPKIYAPNSKPSSTSDKDHDGYNDHDRDDRNNRKDGKDRDDRDRSGKGW